MDGGTPDNLQREGIYSYQYNSGLDSIERQQLLKRRMTLLLPVVRTMKQNLEASRLTQLPCQTTSFLETKIG
jgi:hypothetical protein